ncbi:hypothetical protein DL93DRAFT_2086755 [Clavulina sp. PMI_390]|nr:hypothetical protein DL93DRAFT_2086755 [Clavulina sp. PMI_390]
MLSLRPETRAGPSSVCGATWILSFSAFWFNQPRMGAHSASKRTRLSHLGQPGHPALLSDTASNLRYKVSLQ